jgi:hypothetical protein
MKCWYDIQSNVQDYLNKSNRWLILATVTKEPKLTTQKLSIKSYLMSIVIVMLIGICLVTYISYLFPQEAVHWWQQYQQVSLYLANLLTLALAVFLTLICYAKQQIGYMVHHATKALKFICRRLWHDRFKLLDIKSILTKQTETNNALAWQAHVKFVVKDWIKRFDQFNSLDQQTLIKFVEGYIRELEDEVNVDQRPNDKYLVNHLKVD